MCVGVWVGTVREEGEVYPSEELLPVVVTLPGSHDFTAAAVHLCLLTQPDTLTCLSPPPSSHPHLSLSLSLHIQQSCPPLLLITLSTPAVVRSLLEGDTVLLLTHCFCMTVTKVR